VNPNFSLRPLIVPFSGRIFREKAFGRCKGRGIIAGQLTVHFRGRICREKRSNCQSVGCPFQRSRGSFLASRGKRNDHRAGDYLFQRLNMPGDSSLASPGKRNDRRMGDCHFQSIELSNTPEAGLLAMWVKRNTHRKHSQLFQIDFVEESVQYLA
jgi:hypothetical protein